MAIDEMEREKNRIRRCHKNLTQMKPPLTPSTTNPIEARAYTLMKDAESLIRHWDAPLRP